MCLALPAEVLKVKEDIATVKIRLTGSEQKIALLPEVKIQKGDLVLVHAGFAILLVDEEYADEADEDIRACLDEDILSETDLELSFHLSRSIDTNSEEV